MKVNSKNTISFLISLLINVFELLLILLISFFYTLRVPYFKNSITNELTEYLNQELNTEIKVKEVSFGSFKTLELNDLLIPDQNGDTILYVPSVYLSIHKISLLSNSFHISKLVFNNAQFNIKKNKGATIYEFEYLLNKFENNQRKSKNYQLLIDEVQILNSTFNHEDLNVLEIKHKFDYQCFRLIKMNLLFKKTSLDKNAISTKVSNFNFKSDQGLDLVSLNGNLYLDSSKIKVSELDLTTTNSFLRTKEFNLFLNNKNNPDSEIFNFKNLASNISALDFNLFSNYEVDTSFEITLNSNLNATNDYLDFKNLSIKYINSDLSGDLNIRNWNNNNLLAYDFDLHSEKFRRNDLFKLEESKHFNLPPLIKNKLLKLNDFKFFLSGNGTPTNIKSNFIFNSSIGNLSGSLDFLKNEFSDISYDVNLIAENFSGNLIFDELDIENFDANVKINGKGLYKEDIDLKIDGYFSDFTMNNYQYEDITITGAFKNKAFNGNLKLSDKSIDLTFDGNVDFNKVPTEFDFSLKISDASLDQIGITSNHTNAKLSFVSYFNGFGNNWKDFTGYVNLDSIFFEENNQVYNFGEIQFDSQTNDYYHLINFKSDVFSFNISGDFKFDELYSNLQYSASKILPNLIPETSPFIKDQFFDLDLTIHDFQRLNSFVYPSLNISNNAHLNFSYSKNEDVFDVNLAAQEIIFNDWHFKNLELFSKPRNEFILDSNFNFIIQIDSVNKRKYQITNNISVNTSISNNQIFSDVQWGAQDSLFKGNILSEINLFNDTTFDIHILDMFLKDSLIGVWNIIDTALFSYKSGRVELDTVYFKNDSQSVIIFGDIGSSVKDTFNISLANISLANIPKYFNIHTKKLDLSGILNSDIDIYSLTNNFHSSSESSLSNFILNDYAIGKLNFSSKWDYLQQSFILNGGLLNENFEKEVELVNCSYQPSKDLLNRFSGYVSFNNTQIDFLNPYLPNDFLTGLNGGLNGDLRISGSWNQPVFKGILNIDDVALKLNQYNSMYKVAGKLIVKDSSVEILNGTIKDVLNVSGEISGRYHHDNFSKYSLDLGLSFDQPLLLMNNSYKENPYYYGKAFITGYSSITYDSINDLSIKVNAKTEENTSLYLPLYGNEEVVLHDFISFRVKDSVKSEELIPVIGNKEKLNIDIELEITDDAEVKLIFEDLVGDVMEAKGEGNIKLNINQNYDISMYGNYTISQGEYVFALKEFINKKFILRKGGEITWLGDPYTAKIDLSAIYPLRTSLFNILPEIERDNWKHKSLVDVYINLENDLMNPDVNFNVKVPKANESVKASLQSIFSNNEELNKQVFSLLILNQFITPNHLNVGDNGKRYDLSTSEMLSNQLGNMISSFTDEFDIGFDYSLGDPISNDKLTVAMSTQQFNDRLSIQTNLGMSQSNNLTQNPNTFIGDVNVEYKLNSVGNVSIHAYNESNEYDLSNQNQSNYTQGVGISYKQSFNSLSELICEMKNLFSLKTKKHIDCQNSGFAQ